MRSTVDRETTLTTCEWNGQHAECELCGKLRLCTERCDMLTCQHCQAEFLPARRGL